MSYRSERSVRREVAEELLALLDDTSRKLDDENHDRQILLEDLITRACMMADELGADLDLFPSLENFRNPLIPLLDESGPFTEPEYARGQARGVASVPVNRGHFGPVSDAPLVSAETIRQAHNLLRFDGVQRHPFVPGPEGMAACRKMIDAGDRMRDCGLPAEHAVHDWEEAK